MEDQTPLLQPSELYDKRRSKDASRLRAYNKILEQIYNRIRVTSKLPNSQCYLLYTVPPFILGLPKIDIEDCMVYLIYQLRHASYDVRYTFPNMLYISWLHHEKSYLVEQSPIMQSMLESAERTQAEIERKEKEASRLLNPKKSQRKVKIHTPGELQSISGVAPGTMKTNVPRTAINNILQRPLSNPTAGPPPPSANDYVPPPTFLQNMTNPPLHTPTPKSVPEYFKR
jgi:effector-binding domain-containing protein